MKEDLIKLLRRQWVTPAIALHKVGCMSLSQRCGEFRKSGIKVVSQWVKANGKRFKKYTILKG